jgi:NitT/TauT family transport system permease protein
MSVIEERRTVPVGAADHRGRPRPGGLGASARLLVGRVLVGLGLLGIWQLVSTAGWLAPSVSRTPGEVGAAVVELLAGDALWPAMWSTLAATLIALALASVVGITAGVLLGLSPRVEKYVEPYISAANAMPRIALAPVLIIYLGLGQASKIALAFTIVVFVLLINAQAGVRSTDRELLVLAKVMNMSRAELIGKVILPGAVPSIFAGLRLGLIYALLGVTASELIAAERGLGQLIAAATGVFDLSTAYAVMLVLAVVGALANLIMLAVERRLLRWQS